MINEAKAVAARLRELDKQKKHDPHAAVISADTIDALVAEVEQLRRDFTYIQQQRDKMRAEVERMTKVQKQASEVVSGTSANYEELRALIDGGSESMTHEDAVHTVKVWADAYAAQQYPMTKVDVEPVKHVHEWFRLGTMEPGQCRCIHCGLWNYEEDPDSALASLRAENERLREALEKDIEEWGSYASEYLHRKHDLQAAIDAARTKRETKT